MADTNCTFFKDSEVATLLGMSSSWVRGQRFKRRRGQEHFLAVDPIYIGKMPKYHRSEIESFINEISARPAFE